MLLQQAKAGDIEETDHELIMPVVMMTEGVRTGSKGAVLHLKEHYRQSAANWGGIPVTLGHPELDGEPVSVNEAPDSVIIGYLSRPCDCEGKLKANVHINKQKAIALNNEAVNKIKAGENIDVSIGAYTTEEQKAGEYEGTQYQAISTYYKPDHLALLPDSEGACSWDDGCGLNRNEDHGEQETKNDLNQIEVVFKKQEQLQKLRLFNSQF